MPEHADGRRIVYGMMVTLWQDERDLAGGELVPAGGDTIAAIRRVGEAIGGGDGVIQSTISDLPAEDL